MKLSSQSRSLVEQALRSALRKFSVGQDESVMTDIHIQPRNDAGELVIYDDNDEELARTLIPEWAEAESIDERFYADATILFRDMLNRWQKKEIDKLSIVKPYSFVLVDDEKETVEELLLVDDDTLMLSKELLEGWDEELDEFLKKLLEE